MGYVCWGFRFVILVLHVQSILFCIFSTKVMPVINGQLDHQFFMRKMKETKLDKGCWDKAPKL